MLLAIPLFDGKDAWITPSVAVTFLALLFTVGSFWWIQVRRGRVRCYTSHVYSGVFSTEMLLFILPLVFYNAAPASLVIIDVRLRVAPLKGSKSKDATKLPIYLHWIASHASVYPKNEARVFAAPFAIDGRKTAEKFIEFQCESPATLLEDGPYEVTVEALVEPRRWWSGRHRWNKIFTYKFNAHLASEGRTSLIARSNDPNFTKKE